MEEGKRQVKGNKEGGRDTESERVLDRWGNRGVVMKDLRSGELPYSANPDL
jgi:hypothetical protein